MADNPLQPGPLPVVRRVTPINTGVKRFDSERQGLPDRVIYHSTVANNKTGSSAGWLSTHPTSGVSIHTLANRDGSLTEICPPLYKAYHAGYCLPGWSNATALGIECENASGNANGDVEPYPDAQIVSAAYRVATWCYSFGIPLVRVQAHKDVAVYGPDYEPAEMRGKLGRKRDPVGPFPDDRFHTLVQAWLTFFAALPESEIAHYVQGAPLSVVHEYKFVQPPTISLPVFTQVLQKYNSPVLSEYSPDLYFNLCVEKGINPAVALAFFAHESSCGTDGVAVHTKNWGNVRSPENPALVTQDSPYHDPVNGNFAKYNYWLDSLRDWCLRILGQKYLGSNPDLSIHDALQKYAPTGDGMNNPNSYYDTVITLMAQWAEASNHN